MLHSLKSLVFRKFAELKAPAEIQRAHSAFGNIVPAVMESLDHEAKRPGSHREGGREGGGEGGGESKSQFLLFFVVFVLPPLPPPPSPGTLDHGSCKKQKY